MPIVSDGLSVKSVLSDGGEAIVGSPFRILLQPARTSSISCPVLRRNAAREDIISSQNTSMNTILGLWTPGSGKVTLEACRRASVGSPCDCNAVKVEGTNGIVPFLVSESDAGDQ